MQKTRPKILYVEDDPDCRDLIPVMLDLSGREYDIFTAASSVEAINMIDSGSFDLYILDHWMPGIEGPEIARRIRSTNKRSPILFFSAVARDTEHQEAYDAGADAYLVKPNDLDKLPETVEMLLNRPSSVQA